MPRKGKKSQAAKARWQKFDDFLQSKASEQTVSTPPQTNRDVNVPETSNANVTRVLASRSQAHWKYAESNNSQCTCNSATFLAFLHELGQLRSADLDLVLDGGHAMYTLVMNQLIADKRAVSNHLNTEELPEIVLGNSQQYIMTKCESMIGMFADAGAFPNLSTRLQRLSSDVNYALLIMASQCIAVFRDQQGKYGFFDPHSRRPDGLPTGPCGSGTGTAVMFTFTHLNEMIRKIVTVFQMLGARSNTPYELMPVTFQSVDELCVDEIVPHIESVADDAHVKEHQTVPSVTEETEMCLPSCSVTESTACVEMTSDKTEVDLTKYSKQQRLKIKRRLVALEKKQSKKDERNRRLKITEMAKNMKRRERYAKDENVKKQKKSYEMKRYRLNVECRKRKRSYITARYQKDLNFQQRQKFYIRNRYSKDSGFKLRQKSRMTSSYRLNVHFRQSQKSYVTRRYANDPEFRSKQKETMRERMRNKYHGFRMTKSMQCAVDIKRKYRRLNRQNNCRDEPQQNQRDDSLIREAVQVFQSEIKKGPTHVCTVCHRALFPNQVKCCNRANYVKNPLVAETCLTGQFVHVCSDECEPCTVPDERKREWICHTCHEHLKNGRMPSLATANSLQLADIPAELKDLNILERHLVAKCITFAKIIPLPKGQQRAVHGNVVCVPSEVQETVNALPRLRSESQVMRVKLKRQLCFKGHQVFQTVTWSKLVRALLKLKEVHPQYEDVTIRDEAELCDPTLPDEGEDDDDDDEDKMDDADYDAEDLMEIDAFDNEALCEAETDAENIEQIVDVQPCEDQPQQQSDDTEQQGDEPNGGVALESCLQPCDVAEEILSFSEGIYSVAPAEGNRPVSFFRTPHLEAMAFPVQFPTGQNTLDSERPLKLTPSSYFKTRLCCVDDRFARDTNYLFFAQFVTEIYQATSSMRIQLRKGRPFTKDGRRITNAMLQDREEVERLVRNRYVTRFMSSLRGTPAYWEKTTKDLFAMIRQLGTPTFFCTFSAAEMRWKEVITVIKAQQGEQVNFDELDWASKCEILRSNPVTTMRMFDKRVEALFRDLLLSPTEPIGKVIDYFYRLEFQHRGSPHIHCLIWVEGAPVFEEDDDQVICDFVDRYISAQLPDTNTEPELHKKVTEVQMHSKKHSKTCVKHPGASCRFGFPKQPCPQTMILRGDEVGDQSATDAAKDKLTKLKSLLEIPENANLTLEQLLTLSELTEAEYLRCLQLTTKSSAVLYKRDPKDAWVNCYNHHLLEAWDANLDIQFILNAYSCIMYICSYITKAEHGLSEYLKSMMENLRQENVNESDEMKQIMQAYSKKREVSAQECVARACGLHMKKCSRSVVFVPTDDNALKMSYPLSALENRPADSENIWMSGLSDKYKCRPETPEFEAMCLADFAATCRIVYGEQRKGPNVHPLLNEMGFVQRRTNDKPAVIKYHRFSQEKNPEEFYGTLLKLYLPHRAESQLKSRNFPTYHSFHNSAAVWLPGAEHPESVLHIVKRNREKYEKHRNDIDNAIEEFEQTGGIRDEWSNLAPECELQRLECIEELDAREPACDNVQENVPDLNPGSDSRPDCAVTREVPEIDPTVLRQMFQNLNQKQASMFYTVRDWCLKRVCGLNPDQFFYYINGGAGTGKSHLIKCIHAEASKILRRLPRHAEEADISKPTVLLSSFTGTAAFNINGTTLHSLLKLPRNLKPPFHGLGNKLDEVRAELSNAEILIIDEISMVSRSLFAYVDARLKQIKGSVKPFGGISILAVGDFYQLPPVRQCKPLCVYDPTQLDLWCQYFKMITLTEIMRQKDDVPFAEMLNRIRVKEKTDDLLGEDKGLLYQTITDQAHCPKDVLHIYATNKQVDEHNSLVLGEFHSDIVKIDADDYKKDPRTGRMERKLVPFQGTKNELPNYINVALGARVMITRNINVQAGLCNGTFALISQIVTDVDSPHVCKLGLQLVSGSGTADNVVFINREEENLKQKGVVRRQFPLKLAFACTIHKVQGMTASSAVVSLKGIFEHGMAYVALSRVTSLSGLHILDFDEKRIHANPEIKTALASMTEVSLEDVMPLLHLPVEVFDRPDTLTVVHHNVEGLPAHISDLKCHHELHMADILCLTETHLVGSFVSESLQLDGYSLFHRNRSVSYTNNPNMANKSGGGVAIYVKNHIRVQEKRYIQSATDIEFTVVKLEAPFKGVIAAVYRPPNYSVQSFLSNLQNLLNALEIFNQHPMLVCGDFNEDQLSEANKPILELFESKGYGQVISSATTEKNTLLDPVFISRPQCCLSSGVLKSYYSYHNPVYCVVNF